MKKLLIACSFFLMTNVFGQIQEIGQPESFKSSSKDAENIAILSYTFTEKQIKAVNDSAYDVGVAEQVDINFFNFARKTISTEGFEIYRLEIFVSNALGIGLDFNLFYLPKNCKLFAYNEDKSIILGAFSSLNNRLDSKFSIQPIAGETIILEYNQPTNIKEVAKINIDRIAEIYRPLFGNSTNAQQKNSSCYTDVHCVPNLEVERSVLKWFFYDTEDESYYVCSCALANQDVPANAVKPYMLTANHCGKNADLSTAIFYFNYQNSNCGNNNANENNYTMVGGIERAKRSIYDMFLIELYSFPPPDYNVHLSGWDRSKYNSLTSDMMGIHHPHGDEKNVSLGSLKANTNPGFWRVEWDRNNTPTHKGSSGSPLFEDNNDRIIGWLSHGIAECDNLDAKDKYGKFRLAWSGPSNEKRLWNWLDPNNNDNNQIDGRDPCFTNLLIQNRLFYSAQQLYQPENKVTVQAGNTIETSGGVIITSGSEYKFTAGQQIILNPGFYAVGSSNFIATIEPCDQIAKNMTYSSNANTLEDKTELYRVNTEFLDLKINDTKMNIYPNPSFDKVIIEYSLKQTDIVSIDIISINGTHVKTILRDANHSLGLYQIEVDVSNFQKGVYTCILKTSESVYTKKIVII